MRRAEVVVGGEGEGFEGGRGAFRAFGGAAGGGRGRGGGRGGSSARRRRRRRRSCRGGLGGGYGCGTGSCCADDGRVEASRRRLYLGRHLSHRRRSADLDWNLHFRFDRSDNRSDLQLSRRHDHLAALRLRSRRIPPSHELRLCSLRNRLVPRIIQDETHGTLDQASTRTLQSLSREHERRSQTGRLHAARVAGGLQDEQGWGG